MPNDLRFILDIGSSTLRLYAVGCIAYRPHIIATESVVFDGFMDGEFLSPDKFQDDLNSLFKKMEEKFRTKIVSVIVGVPAEFSVCVCKRISRKFNKLHKVTNKEIFELFNANASFGDSENYRLISFSPLQFVLDNGYVTDAPTKKKTLSLTIDASYILVKNNFLEFVRSSLNGVGIKKIDFLSETLGQCSKLKKLENLDEPFILVDCGHLTTSVSVFKGEGLMLLSSFSFGGGHITADLMDVLGLSYLDAEAIKKKAVLTIANEKTSYYEVCNHGNLVKSSINITNQVIKSRIEAIAKVINEIVPMDIISPEYKIYLTGDGISNFRGVKNILEDVTSRKVMEFKRPYDNSKEKFQTEGIGLMDLLIEIK